MKLTAIFEQWLLGDGDYPPLSIGDQVNLAFQMKPQGEALVLEDATASEIEQLVHQDLADFNYTATLLRKYISPDMTALGIFEARGFRFYIEHEEIENFSIDKKYRGSGTLLLDEYTWTENLPLYEDPPDLFYNLRVTGIQRIKISERFIHRSEHGISMPARVPRQEIAEGDISEISTMEGEISIGVFYAIDFDDAGLEKAYIPKTFLF